MSCPIWLGRLQIIIARKYFCSLYYWQLSLKISNDIHPTSIAWEHPSVAKWIWWVRQFILPTGFQSINTFFFFSPSLYLINVAYQCALIVNEPHSRMEGVFQETVALYYVCFPYLKDEDKMMLSCLHIEILWRLFSCDLNHQIILWHKEWLVSLCLFLGVLNRNSFSYFTWSWRCT